ncbi:TolC family protein [Exilibacterium tricleocarpae]|uniref:TolC family protein n=1 Tax=Exilibacterium tricleocarpae TaxID=2591008 RepID=A0A545STF1_9GAMM|nr:TolC family protein [Exilibacterium tricleocarpae]TQV68238.1 TolC family protein [Exilibacterium tricleocarpae]
MLMKSTVALMALTVAVSVWARNPPCPGTTAGPTAIQAQPDRSPSISVEQAVALALKNDLRKDAALAAVTAARSENRIASLRPPDEIRFQTEDFPRSESLSDTDPLEVTGSYARVWERGGKREARAAVAASGVDIARAAAAVSSNQIAYDVRRLYAAALVASARQAVVCMEIEHVNAIKGAIDERVRRSADPALATVRATTELLTAQSELRLHRAQQNAFLEQLSNLTGQSGRFTLDRSALAQTADVRAVDLSFSSWPDLLALEARQREARAISKLEQAGRKADITWHVGIRNFGASDDFGVTTGISIPFGMGARSDAKVARARAKEQAIEAEKRVLLQQVVRETTALRQASAQAVDMLAALDEKLIPEAGAALKLAEEGYRRGALSFRDILDAHEVLIALHKLRVDHLETLLMNDAALQRLTGDVAAMEAQP